MVALQYWTELNIHVNLPAKIFPGVSTNLA